MEISIRKSKAITVTGVRVTPLELPPEIIAGSKPSGCGSRGVFGCPEGRVLSVVESLPEMNSFSVYVAFAAFSLVRSHLAWHFGEPFATFWHLTHLRKGAWKPEEEIKKLKAFEEKTEWETKEEQKNSLVEEKEREESDLSRGFRHFKSIYDQCKGRVNRKLKTLIKTKVQASLGKELYEFKEYVLSLYKCLKVLSFLCLDQVLEEEMIPLTRYAYFVKDKLNRTQETQSKKSEEKGSKFVLSGGRSLGLYARTIVDRPWGALVRDRLVTLLKSYSIKFQLEGSSPVQGRGRRRDHRMFAMMVMGFMIMASILIPMGFQFLTVLGGKSLLMAKMALIMSAINGLKKIATSNVGYGFYHTGADGHHHEHLHHGFHEKLYQNGPNQYGFGA